MLIAIVQAIARPPLLAGRRFQSNAPDIFFTVKPGRLAESAGNANEFLRQNKELAALLITAFGGIAAITFTGARSFHVLSERAIGAEANAKVSAADAAAAKALADAASARADAAAMKADIAAAERRAHVEKRINDLVMHSDYAEAQRMIQEKKLSIAAADAEAALTKVNEAKPAAKAG